MTYRRERRSSTRRSASRSNNGRRSYRARARRDRRGEERRVETITYALAGAVILFALLDYIPGNAAALAGAAVLLGSAFVQQQRRWRVNPFTWLGGAALAFVGLTNYSAAGASDGFVSAMILAGVLAAGFFMGEL